MVERGHVIGRSGSADALQFKLANCLERRRAEGGPVLPFAFSMVTALFVLLHVLADIVTVPIGRRAISVEESRLQEEARTSVNVTVGSRPPISDRAGGRAADRSHQQEPLRASGRDGDLGREPRRPQSLGAGGVAMGRHRPHAGRLHVRRDKAGDASVPSEGKPEPNVFH